MTSHVLVMVWQLKKKKSVFTGVHQGLLRIRQVVKWDAQLLQSCRMTQGSHRAVGAPLLLSLQGTGAISPAAARDKQLLNHFMQKFTVGQLYFWVWH